MHFLILAQTVDFSGWLQYGAFGLLAIVVVGIGVGAYRAATWVGREFIIPVKTAIIGFLNRTEELQVGVSNKVGHNTTQLADHAAVLKSLHTSSDKQDNALDKIGDALHSINDTQRQIAVDNPQKISLLKTIDAKVSDIHAVVVTRDRRAGDRADDARHSAGDSGFHS